MHARLVPSFWTQTGLAASILFPSAWVIQKFLGNTALVLYLVVGLWFFLDGYRIVLAPLLALLHERFFTFLALGTLVLLIGICALVYPLADAGIVGGGTDRDEALNIAVTELLHGRYPYYQQTYLYGQITPFPGAFVLALPFVLLGNSALQNIFWLSWFVLAMKHNLRSGMSALLLLWLLCLLSPIVMNDFVTGGDLIANNLYVRAPCDLLCSAICQERRTYLENACQCSLSRCKPGITGKFLLPYATCLFVSRAT